MYEGVTTLGGPSHRELYCPIAKMDKIVRGRSVVLGYRGVPEWM